ncbi:MAG: recombinase-like helix-turn-helix domain-containing protein, partial [bacterium]
MTVAQPYLDPHQARKRTPDDYENLLADSLERAFAAG